MNLVQRMKTIATGSKFEAALTMRREDAAAPIGHGDARDARLSADSFLADAIKNAKTDVPRLRNLQELLKKDLQGHPWIDRLLGGTREALTRTRQGIRHGGVILVDPPVSGLHTLAGVRPEDFVSVLVETLTLGTSPLEIVALVVWRTVEESPGSFGTITNRRDHEEQLRQRSDRMAVLLHEVHESAFTERAVEIKAAGGGLYRLTFLWNGTDTGVDIGDPAALVKHLCK